MAKFLLLMKLGGKHSVGLGEYQFAAPPRSGEYITHIAHEELDKDETPVAKDDEVGEGLRRRIYRVDAVIHYTEPLLHKGSDLGADGYLVVTNMGTSKKFNLMQHRPLFAWLSR